MSTPMNRVTLAEYKQLKAKCERYEKALNDIASYHGKCMMGPTEQACCDIYEKNDGFDCYRRAFELGSYNSYSELVEIAKEAIDHETGLPEETEGAEDVQNS